MRKPILPDPYASSLSYYARPGVSGTDRDGVLQRLLYTDVKTYLLELLMKQDQMSMAASIESRVPFLDDQLVEHVSHAADRDVVRRGRLSPALHRHRALARLMPAMRTAHAAHHQDHHDHAERDHDEREDREIHDGHLLV